jgi:hypothetical protein
MAFGHSEAIAERVKERADDNVAAMATVEIPAKAGIQ